MKKIVIIGSGMAGGKLAEELTKQNSESLDITVIGEEPVGNYDRIKLSALLLDEDLENFWLNDLEWYQDQNITTYLGEKAVSVDKKSKKVLTDKNNTIDYDILVFATGSKPIIPKMSGTDLEEVNVLRNLRDLDKIKNLLKNKNDVLIIGGGLLGLELADVLLKIGKNLTISHLTATLMEVQLAPEPAKYLEKLLSQQGIRFIMNTYVTDIIKQADQKLLITYK
ncbi:MAG: FAD-dependent oxidoreductase, partial [Spirochaetes bacterium]|nr:FAD-dependent oxidoreductase [Spirochaetota bacterium]